MINSNKSVSNNVEDIWFLASNHDCINYIVYGDLYLLMQNFAIYN